MTVQIQKRKIKKGKKKKPWRPRASLTANNECHSSLPWLKSHLTAKPHRMCCWKSQKVRFWSQENRIFASERRAPPRFQGGSLDSPPKRHRKKTRDEECSFMYSKQADSAGHPAILSVVLQIPARCVGTSRSSLNKYKEPEVLQTDTCLSNKTYVLFQNRHYNALSADIQNRWAV